MRPMNGYIRMLTDTWPIRLIRPIRPMFAPQPGGPRGAILSAIPLESHQ